MSATLISDKLKAALLQSAIQGKLTQQRPEDGDARDILKQIKAEKERLINEKVIKKEKPLPEITEDEIPFDIPDNWVWVRLGNLLSVSSGKNLTKNDMTENGKYPVYGGNGINGFYNDYLVQKNTLVIGRVGFYCGSTHKVISKSWVTDNALIVSFFLSSLNLDFFLHILNFLNLKLTSVATAQPVIAGNRLYNILCPLPPLAEQHRIVEAIEKALAKIDKLKVDETKLYNIQKAFPTKLRASLLQSAIQGKLTQQLPKDGDARDLLKQIKAEKERLINEKVIKKEKPLPEITEDEIPFDIPDNWVWVRLGDLCLKIGSGSTPSGGKAVYVDHGIKFIRSQNVYNDGLYLDNVAFINENIHIAKKGSTVYPKDLLLNITGGSIGRCCVVPDSFDTANINQHVLILRLFDNNIRFYLHRLITSPFIFKSIMKLQVGGTKEGLSATSAKNLLVPLPPLAEQHRIVKVIEMALAKIDKLNKLTER